MMLTLQILDGGESYLRPLEDGKPLTVGNALDADVRLVDAGTDPLGARIEVAGDRCRMIAQHDPVPVNGVAVREADLTLGDRVELGRAVLVLGQQVRRPATPGDVLAAGSAPRRRDTFQTRGTPRNRKVFAAALAGGLAIAAWLWWSGKDSANYAIPDLDHERIQHARKQGRFDDAAQLVQGLRVRWVGDNEHRAALVRTEEQRIARVREAFDKLLTRCMAEVPATREADQLLQLKSLRDGSVDQDAREAANILLANLHEHRLEVERKLASTGDPHDTAPASTGGKAARREPAPRPEWLDGRLEEVRKLHGERNFLQALELARAILPEVPVEHAEPLRDLMSKLRTDARDEMRELVGKAHAMRAAGRLADGVKLLQKEHLRFPSSGSLSLLSRELAYLSAEAGIPTPARPKLDRPRFVKPTPAPVAKAPAGPAPAVAKQSGKAAPAPGPVGSGDHPAPAEDKGPLDKELIARTLDDVQAAEAAGELDKAIALLDESAKYHEIYQPRISAYVAGIASELRQGRALGEAVAANQAALRNLQIKLDGQRVPVIKVDAQCVHFSQGGKPAKLAWTRVPVEAVAALAAAAAVDARQRLAVAVLGYRRGEVEATETFLAGLVTSDPRLAPEVNLVIARGRGEKVDARGYRLVDKKFVAERFLAVDKLAAQFGRTLVRAIGKKAAERRELMNTCRASKEPGADDALVLALRQQMEALVTKLQRSPIERSLARLGEKRASLDAARKYAKDLIYDTEKYFYPYKPPAVSGERASEYMKVQKEVDVRVAAVRKLWLDKATVPISANLKKDIDALLWFEHELEQLGEVTERALRRVEWVRTIPPVAAVSIRNYCADADECERLVHYMRIGEFNEQLSSSLSAGEVTQVEVTNSYRMMFGHRPLAVSLKLHKAAHGHAMEMATLGYFSHTSPTEERRTPSQRMRLAGYEHGVSENIARGTSAEGAHVAWCHSSGHHRNLLNPLHTEFGVGNTGTYWVQNFGRGTEYTESDAFKAR
ncbi:MAG: hypothetical protein H6836_07350 [Planctomycetes bacterium]|nr:hypothetical protein [Planctomycetota bacterium]MCB9889379.1 hypothetical protein [Planctomycetota bacterium]